MEIELTVEEKEYVTGLCNLLMGQLRGAMNQKAKEENRELIQLTTNSIVTVALNSGFKQGFNLNTEMKIHDELKETIEGILKESDKDK